MKILFFGLSSKFIHTLPAGWFLAEYLKERKIDVIEKYHSVNENYSELIEAIFSQEFDTILFSVYIFNVKLVKQLIQDIRKVKKCTIIVGGPEVDENFDADHIVIGEGEQALYKLLAFGQDKVIYGENIQNLDDIPSPYTSERLKESKNKLIYYESSRGCPFSCSYCMAGISKGVRYFSLERVKEDLHRIVDSGAKIVKFTDRTFNANTIRTNAILKMISKDFSHTCTCFHFEVGGDLFKESTLNILKDLPVGLVQMEAGVQTLTEESLKAVNRYFDKEKFLSNITKILSYNNIHLHLDLIAGLPEETFESFIFSYNTVMKIRPHKLQLGFLKMLINTPIRETYKAEFDENAPYEIIKTPLMSEEELAILKEIDWINERLYNTGKFSFTLELLLKDTTPYDLFYKMSKHFEKMGIKKDAYEYKLYEGILSFCSDDAKILDALRFDYLLTNNSRKIPKALQKTHSSEFKKFLSAHKTDRFILYESFSYLPFSNSEGDFIIKFDYNQKNPITSRYSYEII
jgi:radical SAM superfamily enzyme YgiQ (UPF0313 family)